MGGRLATYEDSGKVFLRGSISGLRGRSYPALQELDSSPLLPGSDFRRDSELQGYGKFFDYRIRSGLFRHGVRPASQEVRPLGRRIDSRGYAKTCKSDYIKTTIGIGIVRTRDSYDWIRS